MPNKLTASGGGVSSYLVRLVVVLLIILADFRLLDIIPCGHQSIQVRLLPPLLSIREPIQVNGCILGIFGKKPDPHILNVAFTSNFRARKKRSF
jgi:hypothetical protein